MKTEKMGVKLTTITRILGTIPMDKEIYASYVAAKCPDPEKGKEEVATVQEVEEKGWTGFRTDDKGLFLPDYMIRGFLKAAAGALKGQADVKAYKSKIDNLVFIFPDRIRMLKAGKIITKPDGVEERPLRAMTMQGPRVSLMRSDYVDSGTTISFTIEIVENANGISQKWVSGLFDYGRLSGLGQFRNGSFGRFTAEIK